MRLTPEGEYYKLLNKARLRCKSILAVRLVSSSTILRALVWAAA